MKRLFHICLTAHKEVLLRDIDDVRIMTNFSALAGWRSGSDILTDSIMSTHTHQTVMSESPSEYINKLIIGITKAFNYKHKRKGPLFDSRPFQIELTGPRHTQMALNYSLRQGMHHGLSETPFAYPWSTCNYLFPEERGVTGPVPVLTSRSEIRDCLSKNAEFPDEWQADRNDILLRPTFEQLNMVENWYGTARSYIFSMVRKTSAEWLEEQKKDGTDEPMITLDLLEKGFSSEDIARMLVNEGNSKYIQRQINDTEICRIIDDEMIGRFGKSSVYELSSSQKSTLARELRNDYGILSASQISRCLVMDY